LIGPGELLLIDQTLAVFIKPKHQAKGKGGREREKTQLQARITKTKVRFVDLQSQFKFDGEFENK
jgi:hypothetical protein